MKNVKLLTCLAFTAMLIFSACSKQDDLGQPVPVAPAPEAEDNSKGNAIVSGITYTTIENFVDAAAPLGAQLEAGEALLVEYLPEEELLAVSIQPDPPPPPPARVRCFNTSYFAALMCAKGVMQNNAASNYCWGLDIAQNSQGDWVTSDHCP